MDTQRRATQMAPGIVLPPGAPVRQPGESEREWELRLQLWTRDRQYAGMKLRYQIAAVVAAAMAALALWLGRRER